MTREEAIIILNMVEAHGPLVIKAKEMAIKALKQPEQKKGYWIGRPIAGYATVRCSVCTELFFENQGRWNYCPNCGAKMGEEE